MSTPSSSDKIRQVEEALHGFIRRELDSRSAELQDVGLQADLDPICREGIGSSYISYIEATLRYANGDVHDILFFYVAREGRLLVDVEAMPQWITTTIGESLIKASKAEST